VDSIDYKDGDAVTKGTVLFTIEPKSYAPKVKQSQAAEESAKATLTQAQLDYQRQADLAKRDSASRAVLDNATASRDTADAAYKQRRSIRSSRTSITAIPM
jgi:multidrug resistance efflux pump